MHFLSKIKEPTGPYPLGNSPPDCFIYFFEPNGPQIIIGAGDEARTRYLHLGKVALYRMSYTRIWCLRSESNQRHVDFQSTALPTELQRHIEQSIKLCSDALLATRNGLEPSTSSVTGWRANRLHHRAIFWWEQQGSNL